MENNKPAADASTATVMEWSCRVESRWQTRPVVKTDDGEYFDCYQPFQAEIPRRGRGKGRPAIPGHWQRRSFDSRGTMTVTKLGA